MDMPLALMQQSSSGSTINQCITNAQFTVMPMEMQANGKGDGPRAGAAEQAYTGKGRLAHQEISMAKIINSLYAKVSRS
jgi:hypothetical protein